jgi:hypothetical protein
LLLLTWIALVFFLFVVGGSAVHAGIRAFGTYRTLGAVTHAIGEKLEMVARAADDAARRAVGLSEGGERLARALASLAESRAELAVLLKELARARRAFDGVRGVVYGKS